MSIIRSRVADDLPSNPGRSSRVHALIEALGMHTEEVQLESKELLQKFHTNGYIEELWKGGAFDYDCPRFETLPDYALAIASGTVAACRKLATSPIAIHWDGGRHHAHRDHASGFCYVADVQLGIMELAAQRPKKRVMYLDLDLHYGDGVASAFHSPTAFRTDTQRAPQVLTLSVHHSSPCFFPPATALSELPTTDTLHPFTLSIPLRAFPSAATYAAVWPSVQKVYEAFKPDYVVLQLGADGMPGDPVGQWGNWSTHGEGGMIWAAQQVKAWGVPMCVLGGGGYDSPNTARAWAGVTAALLGAPLDKDTPIPHHDYFSEYAPSYTLEVAAGHATDENTTEYMDEINTNFAAIASRIARLSRTTPRA